MWFMADTTKTTRGNNVRLQALERMELMPGTLELVRLLDARGIPRGLITRNVMDSVQHFHKKVFLGSPFSPALARCFTPYKPSPASILHICKAWSVHPREVIMIGDSAKDDIVCGNRAGASTILFDYHHNYAIEDLPEDQKPTFCAHTMEEIVNILKEECELIPPVTV
jgi:phosphoglycolate phosphatase-like HAD superfamily hydrolase